jgi:hypothetical protein
MADAFARFYAAFNAEWPQYGMTPEEAQLQERRWRHALGDFSMQALGHAMNELIRTAKKRPKPADVVDLAQAYSRTQAGMRPIKQAQPDHLCSCGCLGTKWLEVMRDADTGDVRVFAQDPSEYLRDAGVVMTEWQRQYFYSLVGQPLTRVRQQCHKTRNAPLPDVAYRIGYEGELPVFDTARP